MPTLTNFASILTHPNGTLIMLSKILIPCIILLALFSFYWPRLKMQQQPPSILLKQPLPAFSLPNLLLPNHTVTEKNLRGQVSLLNIWASWCYACQMEAPLLMKIKQDYRIPIYGIVYRDDAEEAKKWLSKHGNPYRIIADDKQGKITTTFGLYATPETYVISTEGSILYRHIGVIDERTWNNDIYPLIQRYQSSAN